MATSRGVTYANIYHSLHSIVVAAFLQEKNSVPNSHLEHPTLVERVDRLQSIPAVGTILSLTWALEIGEVDRFPSLAKAISYCGLCSAQRESAGKLQRGPLSKQRNQYLQRVLVEAAHLAPRYSPRLRDLYDRERQRGDGNRATLAVARKLVAFLLAVDRRQTPFTVEPTIQ